MTRRSQRMKMLCKVREAARDDRRLRLAEALQAEAVLDVRRADFAQQEVELQDARRDAADPMTFDINQLINSQRHQMALDAERTVLDDQWTTLSDEVERRRTALMSADQGVRSALRLVEKMDQLGRVEKASRDHRELDEAALQSYRRRVASALRREN